MEQSAHCADRMTTHHVPGWNRPVKVIDATSFSTPDTPANQKRYHYPTGQKKGCGFHVMRALAIFSLASGAISQIATVACYTGEMVMLKSLRRSLLPGDIALGDRVYGCFVFLATMPLQGVDVVARLSQCRNLDLRHAPKLGPNDWLTSLPKPQIPSTYMTLAEWKALPATIPARIIRSRLQVKGFRTRTIWIVTTLPDAQIYPATAICDLSAIAIRATAKALVETGWTKKEGTKIKKCSRQINSGANSTSFLIVISSDVPLIFSKDDFP